MPSMTDRQVAGGQVPGAMFPWYRPFGVGIGPQGFFGLQNKWEPRLLSLLPDSWLKAIVLLSIPLYTRNFVPFPGHG